MNSNAITASQITSLLQKGYEAVVDGSIPGMVSAEELAASYLKDHTDKKAAANALARCQNAKCAACGLLLGATGSLAISVTLPADLVSTTIIHLRTTAAIAAIAGYDLHDDRVRTLVLLTLTGESVDKLLRPMGISTAQALATAGINAIPRRFIGRINAAVGKKLISKFSEKGIIQLGKLVPLAGGILSAAVDGAMSLTIAKVAIKTFLESKPQTCRMAA